ITYEASKSGDHALPASLVAVRPRDAKEFIKTTFGAMGQPEFAAALKASGLHRFIVLGAETDVCVLQTILGMRRAGFDVIALSDALVTEEVSPGAALRRMKQAGVATLETTDIEAVLSSGQSTETPPSAGPPVIVRPLEMGIVLHDLDGLSASDPNASAKMV